MNIATRVDAVMARRDALQDAGCLQVLTETLHPRPSAGFVREAGERMGLPKLLSERYAAHDGLEIEWEAPGARGRVKVPSLERWMGDREDSLWFAGEPSTLPARQLRPLDQFSPEWGAVTRGGEDERVVRARAAPHRHRGGAGRTPARPRRALPRIRCGAVHAAHERRAHRRALRPTTAASVAPWRSALRRTCAPPRAPPSTPGSRGAPAGRARTRRWTRPTPAATPASAARSRAR